MQENVARADRSCAIPFDAAKLDRLMEAAGLDVLVATSKHNVQYLLGAERAIFFDYMDALGSAAICRFWSIPRARRRKRSMLGTGWRPTSAPWRRHGWRRSGPTPTARSMPSRGP
jgi:Xaa-Pro aminopeptidase